MALLNARLVHWAACLLSLRTATNLIKYRMARLAVASQILLLVLHPISLCLSQVGPSEATVFPSIYFPRIDRLKL